MQGRGVGGGAPLLAEGSIALLALSQSNILMEKHLVQYSNNFKYFKKNFFLFFFLYRENRGNFDFSHWGRCC